MKVTKIAFNAHDIEGIYDNINSALKYLSTNHIGKTKIELKKAKRGLEKIRPHLKNRGIR